jgi:glycosyltransferase involved in cell wall biosynthesis
MSSTAHVSVVVPVHDGAQYLAEALASVLEQTLAPFEVIVVDDGSTDASASIAASFGRPVRVLGQENGGPGVAMNTGVAGAQGTHVAFISADDRWAPAKLALQVGALEGSDVDLVFGHVQHFLSPELPPEVASTLRCPPAPMPANSAGTLLTRLETFRRVGPFDPRFRVGEFFDWYGRANDLGLRTMVLPQVVSHRRVHETNHSRVERAPEAGYAQVLKAMVDRRRREAGDDGEPGPAG